MFPESGDKIMNCYKLCFSVAVFAAMMAVGSASAACTNANLVGVWG